MKMSNNEVLVKCEHVSKRFCRDLKRSLWYGMKDIGKAIVNKDDSLAELRKYEFWAVKDISFELRRGECLGLIGHNGAGKSTLLKMLNGLINPDQGKITMKGRIGALIELGAGFNPILTGRENVYNNAAVLGFSKDEIDKKFNEIVEFSEIADFIDSPVQNYSSGMKVRLGFAIAAQMEPDILLIDEVLAVGDLGFIVKCLNRIGELLRSTAVIFVSHNLPMMARISTHVLLMDHGQIKLHTNDISEGIRKYVNLFKEAEKSNQGTGDIDLEKIQIFDLKKKIFTSENNTSFSTGDSLTLDLTFTINSPIKDYEIFIILYDNQLREVLTSISSADGISFSHNLNENVKTLRITISNLILATGRYSITFGVTDSLTKSFLCRVTNCMFFTMKANTVSWACTLAPAQWNFLPNTQTLEA